MFFKDPDNSYFKRPNNTIKRGARKLLLNIHCIFCSLNLVQVPNMSNSQYGCVYVTKWNLC